MRFLQSIKLILRINNITLKCGKKKLYPQPEHHKHDNINTHHWYITQIIPAVGKYSTFLKTDGYCIRMLWGFVGCVTTDRGNVHGSGELGGLCGRNAEVLKSSSQTARMLKILALQSIPFSNSAKDSFSSFSSCSEMWFQGYLWWHMVHEPSSKFLLFALKITGAGSSKI